VLQKLALPIGEWPIYSYCVVNHTIKLYIPYIMPHYGLFSLDLHMCVLQVEIAEVALLFGDIRQLALLLCSMTHYDITMDHDVARDTHCDITMSSGITRVTSALAYSLSFSFIIRCIFAC
jgi:hypothetical protein